MEQVKNVVKSVDSLTVWVAAGILVLLWAVVFWLRMRPKRRPTMRDIAMTVEGRKLHTDTVFLERLCDSLLECVLRGEITEQEANVKLAIVAKAFHREELMPLIKAKKSKLLKAQLKANKRRRSLNGKTEPLPIPTESSVPTPKKAKDAGELLASILAS